MDEMHFSDDEPPGLEAVPPSDEEDGPPGLETVMLTPKTGALMPRIDVVMYGTGLLTFSMDQLHVALDSHPQMFETAANKEKKEEKKKEEEDEHAGHIIALDGQD